MSWLKQTTLSTLLGLSTLSASAGLLTYDFTVKANSGPLASQSSTGFFRINDSLAVPGVVSAVGLFVDLDFSWNGVTYDETTANTGGLVFDASGALIDAVFGNHCIAGFCFSGATSEDWFVRMGNNSFVYNIPPGPSSLGGFAQVQLRSGQVSEPASLALAITSLALLGLRARPKRVEA